MSIKHDFVEMNKGYQGTQLDKELDKMFFTRLITWAENDGMQALGWQDFQKTHHLEILVPSSPKTKYDKKTTVLVQKNNPY